MDNQEIIRPIILINGQLYKGSERPFIKLTDVVRSLHFWQPIEAKYYMDNINSMPSLLS